MSIKKPKGLGKKISIHILVCFRHYPVLPYFIKWLCIALVVGGSVGTVSAGFLQSLDWVTNYREQHLWLVALLPIGGFAIGLLYFYWGKDVEAGNNLLIDTIHEPKAIIPVSYTHLTLPTKRIV